MDKGLRIILLIINIR